MWLVYLNLVVQFRRLLVSEDGQDLIEYALLAFLIACGAVASIGALGGAIVPYYTNIAQALSKVAGAGS